MQSKLCVDGAAAALSGAAAASVGGKMPQFYRVGQGCVQNPAKPRLKRFVLNGEGDFNPPVEIALHPVRACQKNAGFAAVCKHVNPAVFKVAVNDAYDFDVVGYAGDSGP
jgi:hypothetical protein